MERDVRWKHVACTGHRPQSLPPGSLQWLPSEFSRIAARLRDDYGTVVALSGGAAGVDLLWAEAAHDAGLQTWLYLPFPGHDARWPRPWRDRLTATRDRAQRVLTLGDAYDVALLHERNARLIADGDAVVAVHDLIRKSGGTASTIRRAQRAGVPIIRVDVRHRRTTLAVQN